MLRRFATAELPWSAVHVTQVDERCVPRDDPRRNFGVLQRILVGEGPLPGANLLAMPVEHDDLEQDAVEFSGRLAQWLGTAGIFDMVQLGLGADGHTASLIPNDPVLGVDDRNVAVTSVYEGTRRMTLTLPVLSAARERLWLVTGAAKADALGALLKGEGTAPAVRVKRAGTTVVADEAAAPSPANSGRGLG